MISAATSSQKIRQSREFDLLTFHQDVMPCLWVRVRDLLDGLPQLSKIFRLDRTIDLLQDPFSTPASTCVSPASVGCRHSSQGKGWDFTGLWSY